MPLRAVFAVVLSLVLAAGSVVAAPSAGALIVEGTFGLLGGTAGASIAIAAIGQLTPLVTSSLARTAVVVSGLTVGAGFGAAAGVLVAAEILAVDGLVHGCFIGGLLGGLLAAFVEPILYALGVPEGVTELLGLALLPVLPTIAAIAGFHASFPVGQTRRPPAEAS